MIRTKFPKKRYVNRTFHEIIDDMDCDDSIKQRLKEKYDKDGSIIIGFTRWRDMSDMDKRALTGY